MRAVSITEAIANPPTNLGVYLKVRERHLREVAAALQRAKEAVKANEDGADLLQRFLRYRTEPEVAMNATWNALPHAIRTDRYVPADDLAEMISAWRKHGEALARFLPERLGYCEPLPEEVTAAMAALAEAEEGMVVFGYLPGDPANAEDEEFVQAMALLGALRDGAKALRQGVNEIANLKAKLSVRTALQKKIDHHRWNGGTWQPDHAGVETLYHTTAYATEVAQGGFTMERPVERRGLGTFGTQSTISFTHDINIAHPIMRALREMWMVAHGQITTGTILRWMEHEGIDPQRAYQLVGRPAPGKDYTASLYRAYLGLTQLRLDPVMTHPVDVMRMLEGRRLEDIGIVAAEVRIEPDDEYLMAEREFRVPADRVLRVWRVM
jgi:hypothetical protein